MKLHLHFHFQVILSQQKIISRQRRLIQHLINKVREAQTDRPCQPADTVHNDPADPVHLDAIINQIKEKRRIKCCF